MQKLKLSIAVVIAILSAATAWAVDNTPAESVPEMPMMPHGGGMMTPEAMMQMMANRNQQQMPMMHPQMMQMMPPMGFLPGQGQAGGYHPGMHMMQGGTGPMMMYPQMMGGASGQMMYPQLMQMRLQHMQNMERYLKNIESLLQQLVNQGKTG